jgi:endoglucanase
MKKYYPEFAEMIRKAVDAYEFAKSDLGVCQTASHKSPYFYEEDNYVDDLQLAAADLYQIIRRKKIFTKLLNGGKLNL